MLFYRFPSYKVEILLIIL